MTDYWKSFWLSHSKENQNADPQAQVLRTLNKKVIEPDIFSAIVNSVITMLEPGPDNDLLDFCCGNGVITRNLFNKFRTVTGVDISKEFISQIGSEATGNIRTIVADARTVEFVEKSFDRILLYAGIQYFSEPETVDLFIRMRRWTRDGGIVVLGNVPDATRRWNFFNSTERESAYFEGLRVGKPILGTWFEPDWLKKLSYHTGFLSAVIHLQPQTSPNHHCRFDLVLKC
jgi:ubiquinone/menaquinone biosynthesis C-methylase UbiE